MHLSALQYPPLQIPAILTTSDTNICLYWSVKLICFACASTPYVMIRKLASDRELQWTWGSCPVYSFFKESQTCANSCPMPENIASYILSSCKVEGLVWHWLFCHGRKQKFTLIFEFLFCLKILLNFLKLSTSFYFWHNHLVHNDCFFFSIFISSLLCYNVE